MIEPITHLSYSGMTTWEQCGRKYWYRYIEGLPGDPPTRATATGHVVHAALEAIFAPDATNFSLTDAAKAAWEDHRAEIESIEAVDVGAMKRDVWASLTGLYSAWFGMDVYDVEMEVRFDVTTPKGRRASFFGLVDMIESVGRDELSIHDAKTGKLPNERTPWFESEIAAKMDQPALYAYAVEKATGRKVVYYSLDFSHDGTTLSYTRSGWDSALARFVRVWDEIMDAIETEAVPHPNPTALCGWCPYVEMCEPGRREVDRRWALNKSVGPAKDRLGLH